MNEAKHAVVHRVPGARKILQDAAQRARVTIDDLVKAGLRRGGVSAEAYVAAQVVAQSNPKLFPALKAWPHSCPFCGTESPAPFRASCLFCRRSGCPVCIVSGTCPVCSAEQTRAAEVARQEQLDREALLREAFPAK